MNNDIKAQLDKRAARLYASQKASANRRGIEWQFSFDTWLEFWGDDLHRRGTGHDRLCMQRFGDAGPYHPDNVKKGYARDNAKTAGVIRRSRNIGECARTKQTQDDWKVVHEAFFPEAQ